MAAFFAIPIVNYPKDSNGASAMSLGWVSQFICKQYCFLKKKSPIYRRKAKIWVSQVPVSKFPRTIVALFGIVMKVRERPQTRLDQALCLASP